MPKGLTEMWLRSEHVSRRLRGRLSAGGGVAVAGGSKVSGSRVQSRGIKKAPAISNGSQRVNNSNRCGRLSRWSRRSSHLLNEVFYSLYFNSISKLISQLPALICCTRCVRALGIHNNTFRSTFCCWIFLERIKLVSLPNL